MTGYGLKIYCETDEYTWLKIEHGKFYKGVLVAGQVISDDNIDDEHNRSVKQGLWTKTGKNIVVTKISGIEGSTESQCSIRDFE